MYKFSYSAVLAVILFAANACSPASKVTEESGSSVIPAWYQHEEFEADSLRYAGFATAVASDSLRAISRAEAQAKAHLENHIAYKLEKVRAELEKNSTMFAIDPGFILTLRNAHSGLEEQAEITESAAVFTDGYYRGFAKASIQKQHLLNMLEAGFADKTDYWSEFKQSEAFAAELNL